MASLVQCFCVIFWIYVFNTNSFHVHSGAVPDLKMSTACYSADTRCSGYKLECPESQRIVIDETLYGIKTMTHCKFGVSDCSRELQAECCKYNKSDTLAPFNTDDRHNVLKLCSGKTFCLGTASRNTINSYVSSYVVITYHCVQETHIVKMCNSDSKKAAVPLYLNFDITPDYKFPSINGSRDCSCLIEGSSPNLTISYLDMRMNRTGSSVCSNARLTDGALGTTMDCAMNNFPASTSLSSRQIPCRSDVLVLEDLYKDEDKTDRPEYMLIKVEATDPASLLTITCKPPGVYIQPTSICLTTPVPPSPSDTTKPSTTPQTPTVTSSSPSRETPTSSPTKSIAPVPSSASPTGLPYQPSTAYTPTPYDVSETVTGSKILFSMSGEAMTTEESAPAKTSTPRDQDETSSKARTRTVKSSERTRAVPIATEPSPRDFTTSYLSSTNRTKHSSSTEFISLSQISTVLSNSGIPVSSQTSTIAPSQKTSANTPSSKSTLNTAASSFSEATSITPSNSSTKSSQITTSSKPASQPPTVILSVSSKRMPTPGKSRDTTFDKSTDLSETPLTWKSSQKQTRSETKSPSPVTSPSSEPVSVDITTFPAGETPTDTGDDGNSNIGLIIGIAVGVTCFLAAMVTIVACFCIRYKRKDKSTRSNNYYRNTNIFYSFPEDQTDDGYIKSDYTGFSARDATLEEGEIIIENSAYLSADQTLKLGNGRSVSAFDLNSQPSANWSHSRVDPYDNYDTTAVSGEVIDLVNDVHENDVIRGQSESSPKQVSFDPDVLYSKVQKEGRTKL